MSSDDPYEITHWYSTIGTGDGHDYATRGYLWSLMKVGYQGLRLPPSASSAMLVFDEVKDNDILRFVDLVRPPQELRMSTEKDADGRFVQTTANVNWMVKAIALHHDPASVCRIYSHLTRMDRAPGVAYIGVTVWETSAIPESIARVLSELDDLVVPSKHTRQAFLDSGVDTRIHVVPHSFDPDVWTRPTEEELPSKRGRFVFYAIATPIERKNLVGLLAAYFDAFRGKDDVVLRVKTMGKVKDILDEARGRAKISFSKQPSVQFFTDRWPTDKIRAFHLDGDCCVSADRGEGFSLVSFEAKLCGNRVIATDWGAAPEFLRQWPEDILVPAALVPVQGMHGIGPYDEEQQWADPDHDALVAAMRRAFRERRPKNITCWDKFRLTHGPEPIGLQLADILVRAKEAAR